MADSIIHGMHGCSQEDAYVRPEDPLSAEQESRKQADPGKLRFGAYDPADAEELQKRLTGRCCRKDFFGIKIRITQHTRLGGFR